MLSFDAKKEDIESIKGWSATDYIGISKYETASISETSEEYKIFKQKSESLENTLKKMPKFYGVTYRGESLSISRFDRLKKIKANDNFSFEKTVGSSLDIDVAEEFASSEKYSVVFEIYSKTGVYIADLSNKPFESEVVFTKNSSFVVINIEKKDKTFHGKTIETQLRIKLLQL